MKHPSQPKKRSKHSMRSRFAIVLGFLTLILLLGCKLIFSTPALTQPEKVTLTFLMHVPEANQWSSLVAEFEEQNPDIDINLIEGPSATNLVEDLYTSAFLLGDSPYDLVYMDTVWAPKFAAAGWLMDLSDRLLPAEREDFLSKDLQAGIYQGKLYRIPFRSDVGMLYYRTDLLQQTGYNPPETFTELTEIAKAIQEKTSVNWGYLWQGKQYEGLSAMFVEILEGFGGFWINAETQEVGLDQPAAINAVNFLKNTIETRISPPGVTTYTESETLRFFLNGETAFLRNWPYVWAEANKPDSAIQGKIALKAMVHAPGETSGACQGGWGIGIANTTKHPEAAWKAIQFFTSQAAQRQFILDYSYVPSRRSLFTDPQIVAKFNHYPQLLEVVDNAVLRPPVPQYSQASDILQRYLSSALTGRQTSEQAMKAAAGETRRLLGISE